MIFKTCETYFGENHYPVCNADILYTSLQLISLSDLENDFINPHDASASVNALVVRTSIANTRALGLLFDGNYTSRNF